MDARRDLQWFNQARSTATVKALVRVTAFVTRRFSSLPLRIHIFYLPSFITLSHPYGNSMAYSYLCMAESKKHKSQKARHRHGGVLWKAGI